MLLVEGIPRQSVDRLNVGIKYSRGGGLPYGTDGDARRKF